MPNPTPDDNRDDVLARTVYKYADTGPSNSGKGTRTRKAVPRFVIKKKEKQDV